MLHVSLCCRLSYECCFPSAKTRQNRFSLFLMTKLLRFVSSSLPRLRLHEWIWWLFYGLFCQKLFRLPFSSICAKSGEGNKIKVKLDDNGYRFLELFELDVTGWLLRWSVNREGNDNDPLVLMNEPPEKLNVWAIVITFASLRFAFMKPWPPSLRKTKLTSV